MDSGSDTRENSPAREEDEEEDETDEEDESLKVLKMRYAKGEISREDFEQKKKNKSLRK